MAAWQTASTSSTGDAGNAPGRHHLWPDFLDALALWTGRRGAAAPGGLGLVRAVPEYLHQPRGRRGGGTIARMVGKRLGWKVYDGELIEAIAHRMEVPLDEVRTLDELAPSVVQDWLLPLREEYYAPQEAYLDHLAKLIEAIGRAGESILVGRGANFMLPRETTLSVRIIAPLEGAGHPAGGTDGRLGPDGPTGRARPRPPPAPVRSHHAPRQLERPASLRHGARVAQPGPGDVRRDHRPRRRVRPSPGRPHRAP